MNVPEISVGQKHDLKGHERLSCESSFIEYDRQETHWYHLKQKPNPERWIEKCLTVESGIQALCVTREYHIILYCK